MRAFTILTVALLAGACAAPPTMSRAPLAPPLPVDAEVENAARDARQKAREAREAGRADRDQSAYAPGVVVRGVEPDLFADGVDATGDGGEGPYGGVDEPAAPSYRTVVETIEVPVEVRVPGQPQVVYVSSGRGYSTYDDYLYNRRVYRRARGTRFPVNTAIGAGLGAIIGHQNGRRDKGALIGGGIGLLLDLNRW